MSSQCPIRQLDGYGFGGGVYSVGFTATSSPEVSSGSHFYEPRESLPSQNTSYTRGDHVAPSQNERGNRTPQDDKLDNSTYAYEITGFSAKALNSFYVVRQDLKLHDADTYWSYARYFMYMQSSGLWGISPQCDGNGSDLLHDERERHRHVVARQIREDDPFLWEEKIDLNKDAWTTVNLQVDDMTKQEYVAKRAVPPVDQQFPPILPSNSTGSIVASSLPPMLPSQSSSCLPSSLGAPSSKLTMSAATHEAVTPRSFQTPKSAPLAPSHLSLQPLAANSSADQERHHFKAGPMSQGDLNEALAASSPVSAAESAESVCPIEIIEESLQKQKLAVDSSATQATRSAKSVIAPETTMERPLRKEKLVEDSLAIRTTRLAKSAIASEAAPEKYVSEVKADPLETVRSSIEALKLQATILKEKRLHEERRALEELKLKEEREKKRWEEERRRAEHERKRNEIELLKQKEEEHLAISVARKAIHRLTNATIYNFEDLKADFLDSVKRELTKCGNEARIIREEANDMLAQTEKRITNLRDEKSREERQRVEEERRRVEEERRKERQRVEDERRRAEEERWQKERMQRIEQETKDFAVSWQSWQSGADWWQGGSDSWTWSQREERQQDQPWWSWSQEKERKGSWDKNDWSGGTWGRHAWKQERYQEQTSEHSLTDGGKARSKIVSKDVAKRERSEERQDTSAKTNVGAGSSLEVDAKVMKPVEQAVGFRDENARVERERALENESKRLKTIPSPVVSTPQATAKESESAMPVTIQGFYRFMVERESIRIRRARGDPWPWTSDFVMQVTRLANVRREHDRTGVLVRRLLHDTIRNWTTCPSSDRFRVLRDCIFLLGIFRRFGSIHFIAKMGICAIPSSDLELARFLEKILNVAISVWREGCHACSDAYEDSVDCYFLEIAAWTETAEDDQCLHSSIELRDCVSRGNAIPRDSQALAKSLVSRSAESYMRSVYEQLLNMTLEGVRDMWNKTNNLATFLCNLHEGKEASTPRGYWRKLVEASWRLPGFSKNYGAHAAEVLRDLLPILEQSGCGDVDSWAPLSHGARNCLGRFRRNHDQATNDEECLQRQLLDVFKQRAELWPEMILNEPSVQLTLLDVQAQLAEYDRYLNACAGMPERAAFHPVGVSGAPAAVR